jgi:uncharacterized protein (TIGR02231 family)
MAFGAPAMSMPMAAPAPLKSRRAPQAPGGGGGRPAPPPAPLAPGIEWLDYGRLRLAGPAAPDRGQLARIDDDARCLELLTAISVRTEVELVAWVRQAEIPAPLEELPPAHVRPAPVEGFDHVYAADQPVDLPADGQYRALPVLARSTTAERRLICVPRETVEVFRQADVRNPLPAPLLPGPVDVYVGEVYLLTAALPAVSPRGTAALGLGVEQAIRVARNTRYEEQTTGLLSGTRELRHRIDVEVRSHLAKPVTLEVRERVPVTKKTEEDVKVAVSAEPPWERFDPEGLALRGGHVWRVTVPPDAPVTLRAEYVITLPAKLELQGGNRREP